MTRLTPESAKALRSLLQNSSDWKLVSGSKYGIQNGALVVGIDRLDFTIYADTKRGGDLLVDIRVPMAVLLRVHPEIVIEFYDILDRLHETTFRSLLP